MLPPRDAGELDQRVTLQALPNPPAITPGGEPAETFSDVAERFARYSPLTGGELVAAQAIEAGTTGEVWLRYDPAFKISAKDRLIVTTLDDLVLNVTAALIVGRKEWWRLLVKQPQEQEVG